MRERRAPDFERLSFGKSGGPSRRSEPTTVRAAVRLVGAVLLTAYGLDQPRELPAAETKSVSLEPPDSRPVATIEVADAVEVALLVQKLKLEPVRTEGTRLYFYDAPGLSERLRSLSYEPTRVNPYDVFRRVVRISRRGTEEDLRKSGILLINREETHWVVQASLANLRALERSGYQLSELGPNEPRPREVRIRVKSRDEVQRINSLHVDIFTVTPLERGFVVHGGAFDYQLDQLREQGFEVQLITPTPRR